MFQTFCQVSPRSVCSPPPSVRSDADNPFIFSTAETSAHPAAAGFFGFENQNKLDDQLPFFSFFLCHIGLKPNTDQITDHRESTQRLLNQVPTQSFHDYSTSEIRLEFTQTSSCDTNSAQVWKRKSRN